MFHYRLKQAMSDRGITQTDLSALTGVSKSAISQYCSGSIKPREQALAAIAEALDVSADWLTNKTPAEKQSTPATVRLTVARAAELMGVSQQFIRVGLQREILPFGTAVAISGGRYTYYISPKQFSEYTGIDINAPKKTASGCIA